MTDSSNKFSDFLLLWLCIYLFIYIFPFPLGYVPAMDFFVLKYYYALKDEINLLTGIHILGIADLQKIERTGSGDTTFDYVAVFTFSLLSLLIALCVMMIYRRNIPVKKIGSATIIYLRYYVAITLISYGLAKFWDGQFPGPRLDSLEQIYGNFSPMGLAWRFFGYSDTYKTFMGLAEIIPGILLLFRRTMVPGALLAVAVITNIVLVNFSFDVPVKLFSTHLLLSSLLILSPFAWNIFRFLVLQKPAQLGISPFPLKNKKTKISRILIKGFLIGYIPAAMLIQRYVSHNYNAFTNEWEGVYTVQESSLKPLDSAGYWKKVIITKKSFIGVNQHNESEYYQIKEIDKEGKIDLYKYGKEEVLYPVKISGNSPAFKIKGTIGKKEYDLSTSRKGKGDYPLINRGFRWINEYPFNR